MKKRFLGVSFYPGLWGKWDSPPCLKQFLQYKLNGIQLLMYVLFIPIVWFTFQYNFIHYAQFFQELYWILALSVSLCPALRYVVFIGILNHSVTFISINLQYDLVWNIGIMPGLVLLATTWISWINLRNRNVGFLVLQWCCLFCTLRSLAFLLGLL